jgi:hypothetical protein
MRNTPQLAARSFIIVVIGHGTVAAVYFGEAQHKKNAMLFIFPGLSSRFISGSAFRPRVACRMRPTVQPPLLKIFIRWNYRRGGNR